MLWVELLANEYCCPPGEYWPAGCALGAVTVVSSRQNRVRRVTVDDARVVNALLVAQIAAVARKIVAMPFATLNPCAGTKVIHKRRRPLRGAITLGSYQAEDKPTGCRRCHTIGTGGKGRGTLPLC